MRLSRTALCVVMICLAGCAMFSPQKMMAIPTTTVASEDLLSLAAGDWCRVRLLEVHDGHLCTYTQHVGQITQVDSESLTMSHVTTRRSFSTDLSDIPVVGNLFNVPATTYKEAAAVTVSRDLIGHVERLSARQALDLKQPVERIGVEMEPPVQGFTPPIIRE